VGWWYVCTLHRASNFAHQGIAVNHQLRLISYHFSECKALLTKAVLQQGQRVKLLNLNLNDVDLRAPKS